MSNEIKPDAEMIRDMLAVKKRMDSNKKERKRLQKAPAMRRKILTAGAVLAVVGLIGLMVDGDQNAQAEKYAEIAALVKPTALYRPATKQKNPAELHQTVLSDDEVLTGKSAGAHIRFPDETVIKIGPQANFKVLYNTYVRTEGARKRGFSLSGGRIWTRVSKFLSGSSEFKIETPTAQAAVRGTRFSILVYPSGATYISVYEGKVDVLVKSQSGTVVSVLAGQELTVKATQATVPTAVTMRDAETQLWKKQQNDALGAATDVLAEPTGGLRTGLTNFEEQFLLRPTAALAAKVHLNRLAGHAPEDPDRTAYAKALSAAHTLQTSLAAADDPTSGYPAEIGLDDLKGLNADPQTTASILESIDQGRLVKYEKTSDGYVLQIRARSPSNALIEIRHDSIKTLSGGIE